MKMTCRCVECEREYGMEERAWRCACGGPFRIEGPAPLFRTDEWRTREASMWRYHEALPFMDEADWRAVSLGEGGTPLLRLHPANEKVLLKLEYLQPTSSFKDRGAAVLIAAAKKLGVEEVIADSSGHAGTSIAAYAARAGIACDVYVPASTSPSKLKQMAAHGATIHAIEGTREEAAAAAIDRVEREGAFYASHVYNPLFYEGMKTYAYEIFEGLGGKAPDVLVMPVGNGTLLLGAYQGFKELLHAGLIERVPRFLAIQAEGCAPLAESFRAKREDVRPVKRQSTQAEGIAIADPARGKQILAAVRATYGQIITAPEESIERARRDLAERGFYVDPTSACTYAGFREYAAHYLGENADHEPFFSGNPFTGACDETVVIPLCGSGLRG